MTEKQSGWAEGSGLGWWLGGRGGELCGCVRGGWFGEGMDVGEAVKG